MVPQTTETKQPDREVTPLEQIMAMYNEPCDLNCSFSSGEKSATSKETRDTAKKDSR